MADIVKSGIPSLCSINPPMSKLPPFTAGSAIAAGDCLAIHTDGMAYPAGAADKVIGQAFTAADAGDSVTPVNGERFYYGAGLVPGTQYYPSATTPGGIADAATSGNAPVGIAFDATRIQFYAL